MIYYKFVNKYKNFYEIKNSNKFYYKTIISILSFKLFFYNNFEKFKIKTNINIVTKIEVFSMIILIYVILDIFIYIY